MATFKNKPNTTTEADALTRYIQELINKDSDWEPRLIACLHADGEFLAGTFSTLCIHPRRKTRVLDFRDKPLNALYLAFKLHYQGFKLAGMDYYPPDRHMLEGYLRSIASKPDPCGISPEQVPEALERFQNILSEVNPKSNLPLITKGYPLWIHRKKAADVVTEQGANPFWKPSELINELQGVSQSINTSDIKRDYDFMEMVQKKEDQPVRIPTGITPLDTLLGGGFAKKSVAGCVAPSSGGKTVAGTQLCLGMLLHGGPGINGLYVTTEQTPEELMPRWVSMHTLTPFEKVADGVDLDLLTPDTRVKVEQLGGQLAKRLTVHWWEKKGPETAFKDDLEMQIQKVIKEKGRLDFIIFDWLGANLNAKATQTDQLRLVYKNAADSMVDLAVTYDLAIIFFTQADTKTSVAKKHIGPEDARECKDLHYNTAVFWGISALKRITERKGDHDAPKKDEEQSVYQREQYWTFAKVRKGHAKVLTVYRDFGYQRFQFEGESGGKLKK